MKSEEDGQNISSCDIISFRHPSFLKYYRDITFISHIKKTIKWLVTTSTTTVYIADTDRCEGCPDGLELELLMPKKLEPQSGLGS